MMLLQEAVNTGLTTRLCKQRRGHNGLEIKRHLSPVIPSQVCTFYWTRDADIRLRHFLGQKFCDCYLKKDKQQSGRQVGRQASTQRQIKEKP